MGGLFKHISKTKLIQAGAVRQRVTALFLFVIILSGTLMPTVTSVAALSQNAQQPNASSKQAPNLTTKEQDFGMPGASQISKSSNTGAIDTTATGLSAILGSAPTAANQSAVQGIQTALPKTTPHEITSLRTATRSVMEKANGSLVETDYVTPHFYQNAGTWTPIDNTLSEDDNAADSTNVFGKALGKVESLVSSPEDYIVHNNSWHARFSPSDASWGMVRIKEGNDQIGFSPVNANKVTPAITTDKNGVQTVHYDDLWNGVSVEYTVENSALKESVVLENANSSNSVAFHLTGATLKKKVTPDGVVSYTIQGAFNDSFDLQAANLILNNFGPVTDQSVLSQDYQNGDVVLTIKSNYLKGLPAKAFPAVIDPGVVQQTSFGTTVSGNYVEFKSDGYVCPYNICNVYAGSLYDSNYTLRYWRGAIFAPYSEFQNSSNVLSDAMLHLSQFVNTGYWTGDYGAHAVQVGHAVCLNSFNCLENGVYNDQATVTTTGDIDVTNIYQAAINNGDFGAWLMIGSEDGTTNSFKDYDPDYSYVTFSYNGVPSAPSIATPTNDQVFADTQPSFNVGYEPNPNSSTAPLQYQLSVSSGQNNVSNGIGTGTLVTSGLLDSTQWTVPDDVLQDGSTYYVQARVYDPTSGLYSAWGPSVPFRVDLHNGNDKSQSYDTVGPVSVDLATGNLTTTVGSHTSIALGGALGVNLDYNSPLKSRSGLIGRYWNVSSGYGGGLPTSAPNLTRVDQNIDFNWQSGSPDSSITSSWFYTAWDGYFVAPQTGTYYFGGVNDDNMIVQVNGNQLYNSGGCYGATCYGSNSITLTAGQVVPIHVEYQQATGPDYAHLYVETPDGQDQVVPSNWLQTGVRDATNHYGLTGRYYADDGSHSFTDSTNASSLFLQRNDQLVSFNWGGGSPVSGGPADHFLVKWTGYITVPETGYYSFNTIADDGSRVIVSPGGTATTVLNNWQDNPSTEQYGSSIQLSANTPTPIEVDYFEDTGGAAISLYVQNSNLNNNQQELVPSTWLSPNAQVLPNGWNLDVDAGGHINYDHLTAGESNVLLTDASGDAHEYTWNGTGYIPPAGEDGNLVRNADGTFTFQDTDGMTYVFGTDGNLVSAATATDSSNPTALKYIYQSENGGPSHLYQIEDGVDSSRNATLYYSGDNSCGTSPTGYDSSAPAGMLCAVGTNDGRMTYFYYTNGQLALVDKPGSDLTRYGYAQVDNSAGDAIGYQLSSITDDLAMDAIAAGIRSDDSTDSTTLSYDSLGRVSSVTTPAASASAARITHSYDYLPGAKSSQDSSGNIIPGYGGITDLHISGESEPNGYSRQIKYDTLLRTIQDVNNLGLATTTQWDPNLNLVYSVTDPHGLMTTTTYDDENRPVSTYGPAPASWFNTSTPNDQIPLSTYASKVSRTDVGYDQNIVGPAVAWFDYVKQGSDTSGTLFGAPKLHTTGIDISSPGSLNATDFPITADSGDQGVGFSATGKLRVPAGTYAFSANTPDGVRLWVDNQLVVDQWTDSTSPRTTTGSITLSGAAPHSFMLNSYRNTGDTGTFSLTMQQQGGFAATSDFSSYLGPDYSLTTSAESYDSTIGNTTVTNNYGSTPELGEAQSTTIDPSGLDLTTSNTYEAAGASGSLVRKTSTATPGNTTSNPTYTYAYYDATETRQNPCNTTQTFKQAGLLKSVTNASPDNGTTPGIVTQTVYDDAGRVIATETNSDGWTCTSYDARGRVSSVSVPAYNGQPSRTTNYDYAVSGNPLVVAEWDSSGTITTTADLLGRVTTYVDAGGNTTNYSYTLTGKLAEKSGSLGDETYQYDSYDRLQKYLFNGTTYATVYYNAYSDVDHVDYNNAGSMQMTPGLDNEGRLDSIDYTLGDGSTSLSDNSTLTQSGKISEETLQAGSNTLNATYGYDLAGRLTSANIGANTYSYGFGSENSSCGAGSGTNVNAGMNGNITSQTANNVTTDYCYNSADELTNSSSALYGNVAYDSHGNITSVGSTNPMAFGYDSSDRNTSITQGDTSVTYNRDVQGRIMQRTVTAPSTPAVPSPWTSVDVGAPTVAGSASYDNGTFTVNGAGYDVWQNGNTDDQFHYVYQSMTGDGQIVARVTSQTNTNDWAKAGLVIKASTTSGSNYAAVMATPSNGIRMEYNFTNDISGGSYTFPNAWLKLVRSGSTITTYSSSDGVSWTQVGSATVSLPTTADIGIYVASVNETTLGTATFDNVNVTQSGSTVPAPWTNEDIGSPITAGSSSYSNGTFTVNGAGYDVWRNGNTDDQFQFVHQPLTGDGQIVARVTSQTNTNDWAKAGLVIKASTTSGSNYASVMTTPSNGVRMEYNFTNDIAGGSYAFPNAWLKLVRSGNTITTYKSADGINWTQVGSATISLPTTTLIGLYVASVNESTLGAATFDNVSVTSTATSSTAYTYGYTGTGDTPDIIRDSSGNIVQEVLQLPGGATLTIDPQAAQSNNQQEYSLPGLKGNTLLTTDATGANNSQGAGPLNSYLYDPYGNLIASTNPPNTVSGSYGYGGVAERLTEAVFAVDPIQMGTRVYLPGIGRFTSMDPVPGGNANAYSYVLDPINGSDYSGDTGCEILCVSASEVYGMQSASTANAHLQLTVNTLRVIYSVAATSEVRFSVTTARGSAKPAYNNSKELPVGVVVALGGTSSTQNIVQALRLNEYQSLPWYHSGPFDNNEGLLPSGGQYLEHDIDPWVPGISRGPERIVVDMNNGRAWYTANHYSNFTELLDEGIQDAEQAVEDVGPLL